MCANRSAEAERMQAAEISSEDTAQAHAALRPWYPTGSTRPKTKLFRKIDDE
jgi:hypothetical protein